MAARARKRVQKSKLDSAEVGLADLDDLQAQLVEADEVKSSTANRRQQFLLITPDRMILIDRESGEVRLQPYSVLGGYSDRFGADSGLCMEWADNQLFSAVYRKSWQFKFIRENWSSYSTIGAVLYACFVLDISSAPTELTVSVAGSQNDAANALDVLTKDKSDTANKALIPRVLGMEDFVVDASGLVNFELVPLDQELCILSENFVAFSAGECGHLQAIVSADSIRSIEDLEAIMSKRIVGEVVSYMLSRPLTADEIANLSTAAQSAGVEIKYSHPTFEIKPLINMEKFAVNSAEKLRQKA